MASLRQIRRRIRSIQSTKQIMRAMQMVSGSKFKRAQNRLLQARAVLEFLDGLLMRVLASTPGLEHPLATVKDGPSTVAIFTSDTGLCGSYNANLIRVAESDLWKRDGITQDGQVYLLKRDRTPVIYIGKRGYRYFTNRGWEAVKFYLDLAGRPNASKAEAIGRELMARFLSGGASSVHLIYSQFRSLTTYRPTVLQWLPIQPQPTTGPLGHSATATSLEYIFEPSAERVFEDLLPRWAMVKFQLVMLEAFTSEHGARMIAMKNATDNAEDLLGRLTRQRNKIRQATITRELSEIVGTVEALK